jgi:hypothetical protein
VGGSADVSKHTKTQAGGARVKPWLSDCQVHLTANKCGPAPVPTTPDLPLPKTKGHLRKKEGKKSDAPTYLPVFEIFLRASGLILGSILEVLLSSSCSEKKQISTFLAKSF